jgi:hypothetical protein
MYVTVRLVLALALQQADAVVDAVADVERQARTVSMS